MTGSPLEPSGNRPAPARGILKNFLRRPSQIEGELSPATDEQRASEQCVNLSQLPVPDR